MTVLEAELYAAAAGDPELARRVLDVFSRTRRPGEALSLRLGFELTRRGLRRPDADRRAVLGVAGRELADRATGFAERVRARALPMPAVAPGEHRPR
jgi:hypothetical protein